MGSNRSTVKAKARAKRRKREEERLARKAAGATTKPAAAGKSGA